MPDERAIRWLLLIHQLPPEPAYLRVKVGRRLARIGAVSLKNTVYVLPCTDSCMEDLQWLRREIVTEGGDASIIEAQLVEGLSNSELEKSFREARDSDYGEVITKARALLKQSHKGDAVSEGEVVRLETRVDEIARIDFFKATTGETAVALVRTLRAYLEPENHSPDSQPLSRQKPVGATWVTRVGVHVDRIASAWLVRRFIDPHAEFKFVPAKGYIPAPGELRFDMFEAEFSHEGEHCTFETLCVRFEITEPGVRAIGEVVHDIDIKDEKFARPETEGVAALIAGLCLAYHEDHERLGHGFELFDTLQKFFARKRRTGKAT